jgi:hypothetical protein
MSLNGINVDERVPMAIVELLAFLFTGFCSLQ